MTGYRCEATTPTGFVQQLACNYVPHGYLFYRTGWIPQGKDASAVDQKLIAKYGIDTSRATRSRRKLAGQSNLHYLRHGRFFVLVATHGRHPFFEEEAKGIRDIRKAPIVFEGYSISFKQGHYRRRAGDDEEPVSDTGWHSRVLIAREAYRDMKARFLVDAVRKSSADLGKAIYCLPFEPYAPVRRQLLHLVRLVNRQRKAASLDLLPYSVIRYQRNIVKPFDRRENLDEAA